MIRFRISHKLFGALFFILATVVAALFLARYIFSLSFHEYIAQVETEKLERLVPLLQQEYRERGGWSGVRSDGRRWSEMLNERSDIRMNRPPPDIDGERPKRTLPRVLLLDGTLQPIIGTVEKGDQPQLVKVSVESKTVGWLGLKKRTPPYGPPAVLLQRQARQLTLLGIGVVGLTALIGVLLSRHLLRPIQKLMEGTRELASRNFTTRITPSTKDELGQLAENFNETAHTLETYEKMRQQWLTDISHELRTPLAVLRGEVEALQDGIREPSPANLVSLHNEIVGLSRLVEDLHLLSMTESDSLSLNHEQIVPVAVLGSTLESFRNRLSQRCIAIENGLAAVKAVEIKGDSAHLAQVFTNLFENVCRYVEPPGVLRLNGYVKGGMLHLLFEDSGPGVADEVLPRLFDRLYRVDNSRNRATGGSGLGLSICRHIVEQHGGTISSQTSPLGGLTIAIKLPLQKKQRQ